MEKHSYALMNVMFEETLGPSKRTGVGIPEARETSLKEDVSLFLSKTGMILTAAKTGRTHVV